jgi:hypothetical protein
VALPVASPVVGCADSASVDPIRPYWLLHAGALIGVTPFFVTGPLGSGKAGAGVAVGAFSVTTLLLRQLAGR